MSLDQSKTPNPSNNRISIENVIQVQLEPDGRFLSQPGELQKTGLKIQKALLTVPKANNEQLLKLPEGSVLAFVVKGKEKHAPQIIRSAAKVLFSREVVDGKPTGRWEIKAANNIDKKVLKLPELPDRPPVGSLPNLSSAQLPKIPSENPPNPESEPAEFGSSGPTKGVKRFISKNHQVINDEGLAATKENLLKLTKMFGGQQNTTKRPISNIKMILPTSPEINQQMEMALINEESAIKEANSTVRKKDIIWPRAILNDAAKQKLPICTYIQHFLYSEIEQNIKTINQKIYPFLYRSVGNELLSDEAVKKEQKDISEGKPPKKLTYKLFVQKLLYSKGFKIEPKQVGVVQKAIESPEALAERAQVGNIVIQVGVLGDMIAAADLLTSDLKEATREEKADLDQRLTKMIAAGTSSRGFQTIKKKEADAIRQKLSDLKGRIYKNG